MGLRLGRHRTLSLKLWRQKKRSALAKCADRWAASIEKDVGNSSSLRFGCFRPLTSVFSFAIAFDVSVLIDDSVTYQCDMIHLILREVVIALSSQFISSKGSFPQLAAVISNSLPPRVHYSKSDCVGKQCKCPSHQH